MGKINKYVKQSPVPLAKQQVALMVAFPEGKATIRKNVLIWNGKLRPTPLSKEYQVSIKYNGINNPEAWVIGDELEKLDADDFPHKFTVKVDEKIVKMCLFLPSSNEWARTSLIANTIIPWAIEWLYFYEIWLATGEWCGGGIHPGIETSGV